MAGAAASRRAIGCNSPPAGSLRPANNHQGESDALDHSRHSSDPDADWRASALGPQRELGLRSVGYSRRYPDRDRDLAADGPPLSARLLRKPPGGRGEHRHALGHLGRLDMTGGAVDHTLLDALDDSRKPEQIVGEIPIELVGDRYP